MMRAVPPTLYARAIERTGRAGFAIHKGAGIAFRIMESRYRDDDPTTFELPRRPDRDLRGRAADPVLRAGRLRRDARSGGLRHGGVPSACTAPRRRVSLPAGCPLAVPATSGAQRGRDRM